MKELNHPLIKAGRYLSKGVFTVLWLECLMVRDEPALKWLLQKFKQIVRLYTALMTMMESWPCACCGCITVKLECTNKKPEK